ncbi:cupin domain-containing protein [Tsukamurella sp. 1534]|uniref:cupin domain-containing protein n=1 Tax=Tsukamurella sp. 1534 TaxID=1151061 RepID=UPI0002E72BDD|nr:cupin domain-containing protein [Tsukamurella sp. 1534]
MSGTWSLVEGLATGEEADGARPHVVRLASVAGATIIQLTFRPGQELADHNAPKPILLSVLRGVVTVAVAGERMELTPGAVLHIDAREVHAVSADVPADLTLLLLG